MSQVSFPSGWSVTAVDAVEELEAGEDAFGFADFEPGKPLGFFTFTVT